MAGYKPRICGVRSVWTTNSATTTALRELDTIIQSFFATVSDPDNFFCPFVYPQLIQIQSYIRQRMYFKGHCGLLNWCITVLLYMAFCFFVTSSFLNWSQVNEKPASIMCSQVVLQTRLHCLLSLLFCVCSNFDLPTQVSLLCCIAASLKWT